MFTHRLSKATRSFTGYCLKSRTRIYSRGFCGVKTRLNPNYNGLWILFVRTPDCKKQPELDAQSSSSKPLLSLALVSIHKSSRLAWMYGFIYGALAVSFFIALFPWLSVQYGWWIVLTLVWFGLWKIYQREAKRIFEGTLWYEQGCWYLKSSRGVSRYSLSGEAVCWSPVVVLPLRHKATKKLLHLVIAKDSLSPTDNARLRSWLRVCLKPRG
jgi:hypothetical protein